MSTSDELIVFFKKENFDIKLKHIVDENLIFQIKLDKCYRYFNSFYQYIGIFYKNKIHIFNLESGNDNIPQEIASKIKSLEPEFQKYIAEYIKLADSSEWPLKLLKIKNKIGNTIDNFEFITNLNCMDFINLDKANKIIENLNLKLHEYCSDKEKNTISLNTVFNIENPNYILKEFDTSKIETAVGVNFPNQLLLCYFNQNNCISQIQLTIKNNDTIYGTVLAIDSNTKTAYEGLKINRLLRAIAIIIAKEIDNKIQAIWSNAVNPISLYLLTKYYNAKVYNINTNNLEKEFDSQTTFKQADEYIKKNGGAMVYVELTPKNIANAEILFDDLTINPKDSKITCISEDLVDDTDTVLTENSNSEDIANIKEIDFELEKRLREIRRQLTGGYTKKSKKKKSKQKKSKKKKSKKKKSKKKKSKKKRTRKNTRKQK